MTIREQLGEQTFGGKIGPILEEIEGAIIDHNAMFENEMPGYSFSAFRAAIAIFYDVIIEKAYLYQCNLGKSSEDVEWECLRMCEEIKTLIETYTGIDTIKLVQETL